ncbi:MAG: hypothetical protein ACK2T5_01990, partial [Anaerolineales bacterium]
GCAWLTYQTWHDLAWRERFGMRVGSLLERKGVYPALILAGSGVIFLGAWIYQFGMQIQDAYFQVYFVRLAPFVLWVILLLAVSLILARFYRFGGDLRVFASQSAAFRASGIAFSVLLAVVALMALTGLGLKPDLVGWGDPGTPVLPAQVWLLATIGVLFLAFREIFGARWFAEFTPRSRQVLDVAIFGALWLLTIWLWQIQPLQPTYFAPEPVAPNFEFYPYSDAANYEISAQELLLGMGFSGDVRRPLYSLFLALAQWISGVGYAQILLWQIPLLALIPPLLFLLGKAFHSRLAGILVAGFAIFHEINAMGLSGIINVSHAKLIMSDLPTALGVIAFAVVLVYWWQEPLKRRAYPLLAGGILALTMLVRIQVVILLPSVLLPIWVFLWPRKRQLLVVTLLLFAGLLFVLVPWLWRGQQTSGSLSFAEAAQESQIGLIGDRYSLTPGQGQSAPLPGESSNAYSQRMLTSAFDFIRRQPVNALQFISSHLLRNEVSTLLTIPPDYSSMGSIPRLSNLSRVWERCCSVEVYVRSLPYWKKWDGLFPQSALIPLGINLFLVAVGIGTAWKRQRFLGFLPIWINLCYALGNALVRSSGWRFNLPVDWTGLFYFALGLVQIIIWAAMFFANRSLCSSEELAFEPRSRADTRFPWKQALALSALFILISAAIPITEALIQPRYPADWLENHLADTVLQEQLQTSGIGTPLLELAQENGLSLLYGRALYPRYYAAHAGLPGGDWFAYSPQDFARLGFYLVGSSTQNIVLAQEKSPPSFPHASDVIVLGCQQDEYLEAQLVILLEDTITILQRDPQPDWTCDSN